MRKFLSILLSIILFHYCDNKKDISISELEFKMNNIAEDYVKLVLEIGTYKSDYVDAYYGPEEWRLKSTNNVLDSTIINSLNVKTNGLLDKMEGLKDYQATDIEKMRFRSLYKQLLSVKSVVFIISGGSFPFDLESKRLYDAEAPHYNKEHFQGILAQLEQIVPGKGKLSKRLNEFVERFNIPKEKLDTVFSAAIEECRRRTLLNINLPENENFKVEFVTGKSWGAYNWYKGNSFSVIQVNTDIPTRIDQAIGLAAHEGYPGHHVFNTLMENKFVNEHGWMEFSVYPLYSPLSLIAEGTANYGIEVAFPGDEQTKFEREILFPLAGLNSADAELYYYIMKLTKELTYAGNEAARNYLDGIWSKDATIQFMEEYLLYSEKRAEKRFAFIEKYRSYVINYTLGEDLVRDYVERMGGTTDDPETRWEVFKELLLIPQTPSGLK